MELEGQLLIGELERGLARRRQRDPEAQPGRHRVVGPDEPPALILEVDCVRNGGEEAVEQIALVEERVLGRLEAADVDERDDHAGDRPFGPVGRIRE